MAATKKNLGFSRSAHWLLLAVLAACFAAVQPCDAAAAPTTAPAVAAAERTSLPPRHTGDGADGVVPPKSSGSSNVRDIAQTFGALAVVALLIFGARYLLNRFSPAGKAAAPSDVLEELAKLALAPRQQISLVRMGQRILLIGMGPNGPVTLSEVTSPQEFAELLAAAEDAKAGSFARKLKNRMCDFSKTQPQPTGAAAELSKRLKIMVDEKDNN